MNKNDVPIITCKPWNPVAIKKVEPYTESEIEKGDSKYSKAWSPVKYKPKRIVIIKLHFLSEKFMLIKEWWHHVIEIPEEIKIIVFISGISYGLNGIIPKGGQHWPISIEGESDEW